MKRLLLAAEKGEAEAQFNLGIVYNNNLDDNHRLGGGNRDLPIAWLLKAARQGLPRAQSKLAELYAGGPDAPDHDVAACAWFTLAAKGMTGANRHRAEAGFQRVASRMTASQVSEAAGLARDWATVPHDGNAAPPSALSLSGPGGRLLEERR